MSTSKSTSASASASASMKKSKSKSKSNQLNPNEAENPSKIGLSRKTNSNSSLFRRGKKMESKLCNLGTAEHYENCDSDCSDEEAINKRHLAEVYDAISKPRFVSSNQISLGKWIPEESMSEILLPRGKVWSNTGVIRNGRLLCNVEETLFLSERGSLLVTSGERFACMQDLFCLIQKSNSAGSERAYATYVHLRRLGFVVSRFGIPWCQTKPNNYKNYNIIINNKNNNNKNDGDNDGNYEDNANNKNDSNSNNDDSDSDNNNGNKNNKNHDNDDADVNDGYKHCYLHDSIKSMNINKSNSNGDEKDKHVIDWNDDGVENMVHDKDIDINNDDNDNDNDNNDNDNNDNDNDNNDNDGVGGNDDGGNDDGGNDDGGNDDGGNDGIYPFFDVYSPKAKFKKKEPGTPMFSLCIPRHPPTLQDLKKLKAENENILFKFASSSFSNVTIFEFNEIDLPIL